LLIRRKYKLSKFATSHRQHKSTRDISRLGWMGESALKIKSKSRKKPKAEQKEGEARAHEKEKWQSTELTFTICTNFFLFLHIVAMGECKVGAG
jgi:hypothetical protein